MTTNLLDRAKRAAANQLKGLKPAGVFRTDRPLYVHKWVDNLVPGVVLEDFEQELRHGDGNELDDITYKSGLRRPAKFCASYSSSALTVNTFAPFRARPAALTIAGIAGFTSPPKFEAKCPNGLFETNGEQSRSPNLDVLAFAGDTVVAVESKFLETLSKKKQDLSPKYVDPFLGTSGAPAIAEPVWTEMYKRVARMTAYPGEDLPYTYLDAAQLVKHYLGLKVTHRNQARTLVYLYWEPTNADDIGAYQQHRKEVADFTARVSGGDTKFLSLSYRQLWQEWETSSTWRGMREHLVRLRARYSFPI